MLLIQTQSYKGFYNEPLTLKLAAQAEVLISNKNSRLEWSQNTLDAQSISFLLESKNPSVSNRTPPDAVYLNDEFKIFLPDKKTFLIADKNMITTSVLTGSLFKLQQKYSAMCDQNGLEYKIDVNNRNPNCGFPYLDCIGRCGKRKLLVKINKNWYTMGSNKKNVFTWIQIVGWQNYELDLLD